MDKNSVLPIGAVRGRSEKDIPMKLDNYPLTPGGTMIFEVQALPLGDVHISNDFCYNVLSNEEALEFALSLIKAATVEDKMLSKELLEYWGEIVIEMSEEESGGNDLS